MRDVEGFELGLRKFEDGPCVGKVGWQIDCDGAAVEGCVCERHCAVGGVHFEDGCSGLEGGCYTLRISVFLCWWSRCFDVPVTQATIGRFRHHSRLVPNATKIV